MAGASHWGGNRFINDVANAAPTALPIRFPAYTPATRARASININPIAQAPRKKGTVRIAQ